MLTNHEKRRGISVSGWGSGGEVGVLDDDDGVSPTGNWTRSSMTPRCSTTWRVETTAASWSPSAAVTSLRPQDTASPCRRDRTGNGWWIWPY